LTVNINCHFNQQDVGIYSKYLFYYKSIVDNM